MRKPRDPQDAPREKCAPEDHSGQPGGPVAQLQVRAVHCCPAAQAPMLWFAAWTAWKVRVTEADAP